MTKEEKTRVGVRSENGVEVAYTFSPVRHGGNQVGYSPRRSFDTDEEMLEYFGLPILCSLADRQKDQDGKNAVRAKFTKDKVKASSVVNALAAGEISVEQINEVVRVKGLSFTDAAASLMGIGKEAKVEPNKVHWDILPSVEAVVIEEEVVEETEE